MEKLRVLTESAKYDVSCASSGTQTKNKGGLGNATAAGICHTWAADGRCVSLLKTLLTNDCIFDCAYCANRSSNDIKRVSFTAEEIATIVVEFYRRNYIEGLFLSSAIEVNPNATTEKIIQTLKLLRNRERFYGYIHVKAIPGADPELIRQAGELADRMSVNIELPTEESLRILAPQKNVQKLLLPMAQIKKGIDEVNEDRGKYKFAAKFVPAGQSTQMIVGATRDSDRSILFAAENLYKNFSLKRVYYSAYVPVNAGANLPAIQTAPPLLREHRLYQADWLLRYYKFEAKELLTEQEMNFDLDFDPKMNWAFRNLDRFPIEINTADYGLLLRIPGVGVQSARRIMHQRKISPIKYEDLKKLGIVMKRAKYFIVCGGKFFGERNLEVEGLKRIMNPKPMYEQLSLFNLTKEVPYPLGGRNLLPKPVEVGSPTDGQAKLGLGRVIF
ncbi:MAG: putative DNA modification/repair radical SAM protein [Firmicutes bacterium HGW-Firmicutes-7]|nr:MAG: putative DNA modification/repair radical SAM protein [Firmicutes bacterium HGW-Firmicutes-7]